MGFKLYLNGAVLGKTLVLPAGHSDIAKITAVHDQGANGIGKLVTIETSAPTYISALTGNLDANGQFQFVVGPSFGTRGTVNIAVSVQNNGKKAVDVTFA